MADAEIRWRQRFDNLEQAQAIARDVIDRFAPLFGALRDRFTATSPDTGLPDSAIASIRQVLASSPEVETAILYGSRALGRHRPASDIDLTLIGPRVSSGSLARVDADLDDGCRPRQLSAPSG
ncbi:MAG: nucleotidyltransferase domain-containing protein [Prochlorococcaceae cyanobacterium]